MSMLRIYRDLEQRTPEWYAARCGIVTASIVGQLVSIAPPDALAVDCPACDATPGESCISAARKVPTPIKTPHVERAAKASELPPVYAPAIDASLVNTLAAERITGHVEETFTSADMWRGVLAEPFARAKYAESKGVEVVEVGFMVREYGGFQLGYSPDGLVGDDGLIEIKAPRQKNHLETVIGGEVPTRYMAQCQAGLLVSGREWLDFIPYCGGMPLWVKRVTPDPAWRTAILAAVEQAEQAIAETVATYQSAVVGLPTTERIDFVDGEVVI